MTSPISPPPIQGGARNELPAYVANGVVGLRIREIPLRAGMTLVSGYSGEHPQRKIEAIAVAPYPLAGDIQIAGVWLSDAPYAVTVIDQAYNFATGELISRFAFETGGARPRSRYLSSAAARNQASSARKPQSRRTWTLTSHLKPSSTAAMWMAVRCATSGTRPARTSRFAMGRPFGKAQVPCRPAASPTSPN